MVHSISEAETSVLPLGQMFQAGEYALTFRYDWGYGLVLGPYYVRKQLIDEPPRVVLSVKPRVEGPTNERYAYSIEAKNLYFLQKSRDLTNWQNEKLFFFDTDEPGSFAPPHPSRKMEFYRIELPYEFSVLTDRAITMQPTWHFKRGANMLPS